MRIHVTPAASERLLAGRPADKPALKIVYDTEGCGCAVDGIARLVWTADCAADRDERLTERPLPVLMDRRQTIFFEDDLTLDAASRGSGYRLSGPGQIYGNGLTIF